MGLFRNNSLIQNHSAISALRSERTILLSISNNSALLRLRARHFPQVRLDPVPRVDRRTEAAKAGKSEPEDGDSESDCATEADSERVAQHILKNLAIDSTISD
jgi:hypothetical protein